MDLICICEGHMDIDMNKDIIKNLSSKLEIGTTNTNTNNARQIIDLSCDEFPGMRSATEVHFISKSGQSEEVSNRWPTAYLISYPRKRKMSTKSNK